MSAISPAARVGALLGVAVALGAAAGCGTDDPPSVAFTSAAGSVSTGPAQYCDLAVIRCANHPDAVVKLPVPAGQPLRISVPEELAAAPWHVVFSYRAPDGSAVDGRSPVFPPRGRTDYQLVLPDRADQLLTAQVQQFGGGLPGTDPDGEASFPVRGSWVLATS